MDDTQQLAAVYILAVPTLLGLLWTLRPRHSRPRIKWLSEHIHWFTNTPNTTETHHRV